MVKMLVVSIINYRTADLTIQAVASVLEDMRGIDGQVVVVDNGSGDGSVEILQAWIATLAQDAPVTLVVSADNTGFSGGHNQGMAACLADYYLIQNSDTLLRAGFLRAILDAADAAPDAGLFAPRIEHDNGIVQDSCFRFHSPASEFARAIRTGFVSRWLSGRVTSLGPNPDPGQIEWASFASILLRGRMVKALGVMDEGYFLYFEDAEYCLRARRAGWKIAYVPQAVAIHFRGGSGPVKDRLKTRAALPAYYYRSRARFLYQAHGRMGLLLANLGWHAGRIIKHGSRILGQAIYPMPTHEGRNIWLNFTAPLTPDARPTQKPEGDTDA
jgi:N-acetylglucosaminyl-diphospho-decaprenol L-rhamnosyltransferase